MPDRSPRRAAHRARPSRSASADPGHRALEPAGHPEPGLERELQPRQLVRDGRVGHGGRARADGEQHRLRPRLPRFALLLIPLLVVIGLATVVRLVQLNSEDVELVVGMNRLRRGYLDLAPELEQLLHHRPRRGRRRDHADVRRSPHPDPGRSVPVEHRHAGQRHRRGPHRRAGRAWSAIAFDAAIEVAVVIGIVAGLAGDGDPGASSWSGTSTAPGTDAGATRRRGSRAAQPGRCDPAAPGSARTSRGRRRPAAPPRPGCPRRRNTSSGAAIASSLGQP